MDLTLEIQDGSLPLPPELGLTDGTKVRVSIFVLSAPLPETESKRRSELHELLEKVRARNTFKDFDAAEWQREMRKDRPLPGRD